MPGLAEEEGVAQEWVAVAAAAVVAAADSLPALEAIVSPVVEAQGMPLLVRVVVFMCSLLLCLVPPLRWCSEEFTLSGTGMVRLFARSTESSWRTSPLGSVGR